MSEGATLIEALRTATRPLHVALERGPLVRELLRGELPRGAYCAMLRNLHSIYEPLERGLDRNRTRPALAWLPLEALSRRVALEDDLRVWQGSAWAEVVPVNDATIDYQRRLERLSEEAADLLLAHAYVRYLGDLSGGQSLQRLVARQLGSTEDHGTRFYQFGPGDEARGLAAQLRSGLTAPRWSVAEVSALAAEARWSFEQHALIFGALAKEHGLSSTPSAP